MFAVLIVSYVDICGLNSPPRVLLVAHQNFGICTAPANVCIQQIETKPGQYEVFSEQQS